MDAFNAPNSSWRHHVQDQEEELVRELMQADDVDAVLARMEGDHFRHLSPVMRKLSAFDGPTQKQPRQQQEPPPSPPPSPQPTFPHASQRSHPQPPPPPPPPPPAEVSDRRANRGGRRGSDNVYGRERQEPPSFAPHGQQRSSYHPHSASSSTYQPRRYSSDVGAMDDGDFSPAARPPPPPPPPPPSSSLYHDLHTTHDPLEPYRRPATAPVEENVELPSAPLRDAMDEAAESRYHETMDSWLKPQRETPPLDINRDSLPSSALRSNPFAATRPPTHAAFDTSSSQLPGGMVLPPPAANSSVWASGEPPVDAQRVPRVSTTRTTAAALSPPRPSNSRGRGEVGELESASQSRIARQLQLLRNYRELAELCSTTKDPSVDLFHALPSEVLAKMQAEQLEHLPQREQSPITVNNNYYFEGSGSRRGSGGGGRGGHSPGRSGRARVNSNDTAGARSKAGAAAMAGTSRSVSELLTVDSHPGLTSHQPSGASSSQPPRPPLPPPLLPSPRVIPLQSPQPSSGPDSPVATPPLSQRGAPLAPPSPSRSYRARSHRSRHHDPHYTPTATTEEAGSSYEDDDEEEDYAGDFMDNDNGQDDDDDDGTAPRPPPPRIIEREQHRRFPNNSGTGGDYSTSNAQPPLSPSTQQQQQPQQQQQQQLQQHVLQQHQDSYPGDYMTTPSGAGTVDMAGAAQPFNRRGASGTMLSGASRNSVSGAAGSDGGRRSVSSAINVLSGEHELRANAQPSVSGMVDSRRGSVSQAPQPQQQQQQQQQQRPITAYNGNNSVPLPTFPHNQQRQQLRRSLSAGSNPRGRRRDGGAYTDPGKLSFSDLQDLRPSGGGSGGGGRGGKHTPEKQHSGTSNGSSRGHAGRPSRGSRGYDNRNNRSNGSGGGGGGDGGGAYARRQSNRRGGGGARRDYAEDRSEDSDFMDDELGPGSFDNDYSFSESDTPGNPQLQTHNPHSSAARKRRQVQVSNNNNNSNSRSTRTPMKGLGGRGRQQAGRDDDGAVHTPRHQSMSSRQRPDGRNVRVSRQPGGQDEQRRRRRGGRSGKEPSSPFYDEDGNDMNSASTYSYSYTTSSDVSDNLAGSYFSPIKGQARTAGRDMGRPPMRGRGRGTQGSPANSPYRQPQQQQFGAYPGGGNAMPHTPGQMRGRGAGMTRGVGRGRGGVSNIPGGGPSNPLFSAAAQQGRGGGGGVGGGRGAAMDNAPFARHPGPGSVGATAGAPSGNGTNSPFHTSPQRRPTQLPQGGYPNAPGEDGPSNAIQANTNNSSPARSPRREAGANAAAGAGSGFVQLPNGLTVPATSPAAKQYRQMLQQQQQMQWQMQVQALQQMGVTPDAAMAAATAAQRRSRSSMGMPSQLAPQQSVAQTPSSGFYPTSVAAMSRTPQMSAATSPSRAGISGGSAVGGGGRVGSPSVTHSNVAPGRSVSPGTSGGAAHIHPGLLYGSLLLKARPRTALVVEDDARGREHSVAPHGDATHEPFVDRGSVVPVQSAVPTFTPSRTVFRGPQADVFPVSSAIHGTTADGVQPLAWKSGGSGCVVGRTGHLPPPPATKLSSHYAAPTAQQQQHRSASANRGVGGASDFTAGIASPSQQQQQQGRMVVSILQQQQHYTPLRQVAAGRRDSAFSLQSNEAAAYAQQRMMGGLGNGSQRSVPLQEQLEGGHTSGGVGSGGGRAAEVVDPYTSRGRAAAERNANLQRFGIAPVQG